MSIDNKNCLDLVKHAADVYCEYKDNNTQEELREFIGWLYKQYGYAYEDSAQSLSQQKHLFSERPY